MPLNLYLIAKELNDILFYWVFDFGTTVCGFTTINQIVYPEPVENTV